MSIRRWSIYQTSLTLEKSDLWSFWLTRRQNTSSSAFLNHRRETGNQVPSRLLLQQKPDCVSFRVCHLGSSSATASIVFVVHYLIRQCIGSLSHGRQFISRVNITQLMSAETKGTKRSTIWSIKRGRNLKSPLHRSLLRHMRASVSLVAVSLGVGAMSSFLPGKWKNMLPCVWNVLLSRSWWWIGYKGSTINQSQNTPHNSIYTRSFWRLELGS